MNFIIKVLINAAALWVAARFVPGIDLTADVWQILLIALVFGLINTFLKPILKVLSLPVIILTLGLFAIIVNVILLAITAGLDGRLDHRRFPAGAPRGDRDFDRERHPQRNNPRSELIHGTGSG